VSIILLVRTILFTQPAYRDHLFILLVGLLLPLISNFLYITKLSPIQRHDISPAVFGLSGVLMTWGLFRYRLFDILPVAHNAILMSIGDGIVVLDSQHRVVALNPSAELILDLSSNEIGLDVLHLLHSWPDLRSIVQASNQTHQEVVLDIHNSTHYFDFSFTPLLDQFQRQVGHLMIFHEISDRKRVEEELRELSNTDALTHLSNRRKFYEEMQEEIERSRRYNSPLSLLMIDIDRLKWINDTFGHLAGDEALRQAGRLLHDLRQTDRPARYGGDEFVVLLPSTALPEAEQTARRLQEALEHVTISEDVHLRLSAGVAELQPEDDAQGKSLLARADAAMYKAKGEAKGELEMD
jgi:diguanylate cyclase (GGDEF)-like protein